MKLKSRIISLSLSVAASILLVIVGCGGGGGGGGGSAPPLPSSADLSLTKTVDVPTPDVGNDVVFTITVSNAGPSTATGVVVTDQLPSGFTYVADNSGGSYNPATGAWSVGTLAVSVNQVLTITATVNDTGNYTNLAEVTANEIDPNTNNDFDGAVAAPAGISVVINQIQTVCNTAGATSDKAYVTVVDQLGNPVTTLNDLLFTLTERQNSTDFPVNNFSVDFTNENLSISIVMDYSQSMFDSGVVIDMQDAVVEFINQLAANDEAEIIKFNETVSVVSVPQFTSDKDKLTIAIDSAFPPKSVSELYRATIKGIDDVAARPAMNRKAVIVITDGRNNSFFPNITVDTVIADAIAKDVPIFTIGLGAGIDVADLTDLANRSGGIFYQSIDATSDLTAIYQQLAQTLIKNQFVFTYSSNLTGGVPAPATLTVEADYKGLLTDSDTRGFTSCP